MATSNRALRGQLAASASAMIALFGSYGRAFGQTASNCTLQPDGTTYLCSGTATTPQAISLNNGHTAVTTAPGFSVALPDQIPTGYTDAVLLFGLGTFTDTNASTLSGHGGIQSIGAGPITINSNGTIIGTIDYGIRTTINPGNTGDVTINAADVNGKFMGIGVDNKGTGGISITTSGTVKGGISATISDTSSADLSIKANNVSGDIKATNNGTGSVSVITSGAAETISNVRAFAAYGGGSVNVSVAGPVSGYLNAYSATGAINVTASGAVYGAGIHAISSTGAISIHSSGTAATTQIEAQTTSGGTASITVDGLVDGHVGIINGEQAHGQGDSTITIASTANVTSGVFATSYGPGHTVVTIAGTVSGNADPGNDANTILISTASDAASVSDVNVTTSGKVDGVVRINDLPMLHRDFSGAASTYGAATVTNAGSIGGIVSAARTTITNTGTITAAADGKAINLTGPNSVVNLRGGTVNGDIVIAQQDVGEGAATINWTGGTLNGGIALSTVTVTGGAVNFPVNVNLTGLSAAQLSGTTHIEVLNPSQLPPGVPVVNLNLDNTQFRGGTFDADDTSRGVNLPEYQLSAINLTNGSVFTLTGGLRLYGDNTIRIDASSTLRVASVNPDTGHTLIVQNDGVFDLTGTGTPGNTISIGRYAQSATGNLIVGVTPTGIDVLTAEAGAKLDGTVTFAWGPGTYAAGSQTFLRTSGSDGYGESAGVSGTFSRIAAAPGTTAPTGFDVSVAYASQGASLVLTEAAVVTPPPPVVVAPADGRLFSEQITGFLADNELRAIALLGRTQPDGGGNSFFNPETGDPKKARFWMEGTGHTLGANAFRASSAGAQFGGDVTLGATGRVGFAFAYDRAWLDDTAGGTGHSNGIHASIYASQPIGPIGLSASFTYSRAWNTTRRPTGVGIADGKRDLTGLTGAVAISAPIAVRGALLTPAIGVIASRLEAEAFRETGGGLPGFAVAGLAHDKSFVSPFATLGFSYALSGRGGVTWVPDLEIGYRRSAVARGIDTILVADDGTTFGDNRVALDRDVIRAGASMSVHKGRWTAYLKYRAEASGSATDHSGSLGMRLAF